MSANGPRKQKMKAVDLENLNGAQIKALVEAIRQSYDEVQFGMLLRMDLNRNFAALAPPGTWPARVFHVVEESQKQGFGSELLEAIEADRPDVDRIQRLRAQLAERQQRQARTEASESSAGAAAPAKRPSRTTTAQGQVRKAGTSSTTEKVIKLQRGIANLEAETPQRTIRVLQGLPVTDDRPTVPKRTSRPVWSTAEAEGGSSTWGLEAIGALRSPYRGKGCVVAMLGTGIDANHPAFAGIDLHQKDFTGSGNGDHHGHSTHVAGSLFGRDIDGQRIGAAPGVTRALVAKTLANSGRGRDSDILRAIQWVLAEGADVVCIPLGTDFPGMVARLMDHPTRHAAIAEAFLQHNQYARLYEMIVKTGAATGKGVVVVVAAGNESTAQMRVPVTSPLSLAEGGISVGAAEQAGTAYRVASFSNSRPTLCAPGTDIVSARAGGGLVKMSGTSMACGYVAGVAALWWEHLRNTVGDKTTGPMVTAAMLAAASPKFLPDVPASDYGAGLVQAPQ